MNITARGREVIDIEIEALTGVRDALGPEFERAAALMLKCLATRGKIVVTGIGKNLHVAEKLSATLVSTGAPSVVLNPAQAMHGDLGILATGDVLLVLSYSGGSDELVALIPLAKREGLQIVTLTGEPESPIAKWSDVIISVAVTREACPFNMAPTASTTATMAVGDALAMVLLDARGFNKDDYAKLHPGGAIGRALLLRVSDIMRPPERVARVDRSQCVKDAVLAMTKARAGSAGVVDDDGRVVGIVTDGDLRRNLAEREGLLSLGVEDIMTPSPITVQADELAVDVLKVFEDHSIDDLLVVDADGCLVSQIDIQDLPKLKIM